VLEAEIERLREVAAGRDAFSADLSGNSADGMVLPGSVEASRRASPTHEGKPMRVFIVRAHHEPASFNGAMMRAAVAALSANGHEVMVSDLYAMGFDPVSDRRNFVSTKDPDRLRQQAEDERLVRKSQ
jgi:hypothetical protein